VLPLIKERQHSVAADLSIKGYRHDRGDVGVVAGGLTVLVEQRAVDADGDSGLGHCGGS
jgi:hypothetical protein